MADHSRTGNSVAVTIYGRTYHLRGDGQSDHLSDLATRVDGTMREIAETTGTADTLKVAILAALNIADESVKGVAPAALGPDERQCLDRCLAIVDESLAAESALAEG